MQAPHVEDELLQRYFDGDLEGAPAASVSQHLAGCGDCKRRHTALAELHELIVMSADHAAQGIDFESAFANIERATRERPRPSLLERLSVWWRDALEQRPERIWAPALGAALAGALLVFVLRDSPSEPVAANPKPTEPSVATTPAAAPPTPGTAVPAAPSGQPGAEPPSALPPDALALANTEVVQVDFGSNAGTVYEIALAGGVSTPVVWINDDAAQ